MDLQRSAEEYVGEIAWLASSKYQTRPGGITIREGAGVVKGGTPLVNVEGLYEPYKAAVLDTGEIASDNAIRWFSRRPDLDVKVELIDPDSQDAALTVTVTTTEGEAAITVSLATEDEGTKALISTAAEVAEAVNSDPLASLFVFASVEVGANDGTGVADAEEEATLSEGNGIPEGLAFHFEKDASSTNQATALLIVGEVYEQRLPVEIDAPTKEALRRITFLNY